MNYIYKQRLFTLNVLKKTFLRLYFTLGVITVTTTNLVKTVLGLLSGIGDLWQRKMFGGIYIDCDDLFIATVHGAHSTPFVATDGL